MKTGQDLPPRPATDVAARRCWHLGTEQKTISRASLRSRRCVVASIEHINEHQQTVNRLPVAPSSAARSPTRAMIVEDWLGHCRFAARSMTRPHRPELDVHKSYLVPVT